MPPRGYADLLDDQVQAGVLLPISGGWLDVARPMPSPNCDERPADAVVDLLVIHNISLPAGQFGAPYIDDLFCNCLDITAHHSFADLDGLCVSAHLLIRRGGEITQYVPFERRAWHAGASVWCGRERCNDFSIGIELEGTDEIAYTERQYVVLAAVTASLQARFPGITDDRIVGHRDVAPDRKTDPGAAFDWVRFRRDLAAAKEGRTT